MTERKAQAEWSRENEAKRLQAGARRMPGGILPPEAARALDDLMQSGYAASRTGCISRALVDARNLRRNLCD